MFLIDPNLINEKAGWNVREDSEELTDHINELCASITEIGVQQPLTVYLEGDELFLSDGHCRLKAIKQALTNGADIKTVPCRVEERYANEVDRTLSMIVRNSGKSLTPLEKSKVIKKLLGFGWTEKEVSAKTGISLTYVYKLIEVSALPEEVKQAVAERQISAQDAVKAVKERAPVEKVSPEIKAVQTIYNKSKKYEGVDEICDLCDRLSVLLTVENLI